MFVENLELTPAIATAIFVVGVVSGYRYRIVWKTAGPAWQAWLYGTVAAACILVLAFTPLASG
ncbi:MAG: hypothetical protein AAGE80_06985 [Pseudomonadota bacterium]